eukprot:TRINITY_DN3142_c0_g2_i1.p1 TRINITY_DN3142_c0_g2~~TRINITY_DN3142_c0_g2_i1.p1  ORF type:complete len:223 (+),score=63.08 TRINITY_DN3142_c0_g2_i1:36-671(+)
MAPIVGSGKITFGVSPAGVRDAAALTRLHEEGYVQAHRETHEGALAEASAEEWEKALGAIDFRAVLQENAKKPLANNKKEELAPGDVWLLKCFGGPGSKSDAKQSLVGYALCELREKGSAKKKQRYCELVNIVVSPDFRGAGAGRALFDGLLADLKRLAPAFASDLRLYVAEKNTGPMAWYHRLGFKNAGWQSETVAGTEVKFLRMMLKNN